MGASIQRLAYMRDSKARSMDCFLIITGHYSSQIPIDKRPAALKKSPARVRQGKKWRESAVYMMDLSLAGLSTTASSPAAGLPVRFG
jgi:hypothetical protein